MDLVIEIRGLVKTFGPTRALDGLDLSVAPGEVHGFLGPNGAGKSTTIRVLLGLLRANAGSVRLFGGDPWRDAAALHRRLAQVPGDVNLWPSLTGGEVIDLLGRLRGGLDEQRRADLVDRFELDPSKKGRAYSKGNRQKVATVLGTVAILLAGGLGLGLGYAGATGDGDAVARLTWAVLSLLPAVLVLAAITRLLYGAAPRAATLGWLGLAFCAVVGLFGTLLRLPHWLTRVSPFAHLALVPAPPVDWTGLLEVLAVAVALSLAAVWTFERRDVS